MSFFINVNRMTNQIGELHLAVEHIQILFMTIVSAFSEHVFHSLQRNAGWIAFVEDIFHTEFYSFLGYIRVSQNIESFFFNSIEDKTGNLLR